MNDATGDATRAAGFWRIHDFVPRSGSQYEKSRNFDFGPERRGNVSRLSPFLRHRLVLEKEVIEAVLQQHSPRDADKFVQEIFWRAYFKGWLEQHPSVWSDYRRSLARLLGELESDETARAQYEAATRGETGIACLDFWARELVEHGYLHNHARMWFASIWVFTLGLPWQLGADFFYRHLVDGDPASNTLGWRWVCGLHTKGKTYLARPANIEHFSDSRFAPAGQLATEAPALSETADHPLVPLPDAESLDAAERFGVLLTEEDCSPETLVVGQAPVAVLGVLATGDRSPLPVGELASRFAEDAVRDAVHRGARHFSVDGALSKSNDWAEFVLDWARRHRLDAVATAYAPVGPVAERLAELHDTLARSGVRLVRIRRPYDELSWPHAKRGFFRLRNKIPAILASLELESSAEQVRRKAG